MKYKLILVCLGFFCAQTLCAEELSSEDKLSITTLYASYRNDLAKVKNSYKEQITKLDELYSNYLEKALEGFKKSGDLDKSLAAKEEIKRFSESKSIPVKLSEIPEIKKLQEAYRTQEAAYKLSSSKEIVAMGEKLSSKLDQLQVELVKSDRLDAALFAKNTSAAITASQDFSDAKKITDAGVAQINSKNPPQAGEQQQTLKVDKIDNGAKSEYHMAKLKGSWKKKGDNTIFTFDGKNQGHTNMGTKFSVYYDDQLKGYVVMTRDWQNNIWLNEDSKTLKGQDRKEKNYFYFDKM